MLKLGSVSRERGCSKRGGGNFEVEMRLSRGRGECWDQTAEDAEVEECLEGRVGAGSGVLGMMRWEVS